MTLELNIKAKRYIKSPHVDELKELMQMQAYEKAKQQAKMAAVQAYQQLYNMKIKNTYLNNKPGLDVEW